MKREILIISVAALLAAGCNSNDAEFGESCQDCLNADAISESQHALSPRNFGEVGGLPWAESTQNVMAVSAGSKKFFGRSMQVADINEDGNLDFITSSGDFSNYNNHTKVLVRWGNSNREDPIELNPSATTNANLYGMKILVGNYCPELAHQIIVASAPSDNSYGGAFGLIYRANNSGSPKTQKGIYNMTPNQLVGVDMAIGDVNGDGKSDLIYVASPLDSSYQWLPKQVGVILDFCNANWKFKSDYYFEAESENIAINNLEVVDLDGKGQTELVVAMSNYDTGVDNAYIEFYKFDGKRFVPSRPTLKVGSGVTISGLEFADINGDGAKDLLVGVPAYDNKGMVRTYTNNGEGMAFDDGTPLWQALGTSWSNFGTSLKIADLNHDGVNDLIVGAPGTRHIPPSNNKAFGNVYVYMGTADGTVFSTEPYWNYKSDVVTATRNDSFATSIAVADIDKSGWDDLIIAAPGFSYDSDNMDYGRIQIFKNATAPCYMASRCLIDNVCYDKDETASDNRCQVCNPSKHNFEFSEFSCTGEATECMGAPSCDPVNGCIGEPKPDGTACGDASICSEVNNSTVYLGYECQAGACMDKIEECGDYSCATGVGCLATCNSDSDCKPGLVCKSGTCSLNHAPSITLETNFSGLPGQSIVINALATDVDNDPLKFEWSGNGAGNLSSTSVAAPNFTIPANAKIGQTYSLTLKASDPFGLSDSANTTVTVSGCSNDINCNSGLVCKNGQCVDANQPPVAVLPASYSGIPGETITIDASKSYDPEGDILSYSWSGNGAGYLDDATAETPKFTIPATANVGQTYTLRLTVRDPGGLTNSVTTRITVNDPAANNHPPVARLPENETFHTGQELILDASGSYDPDGDKLTYTWIVPSDVSYKEDGATLVIDGAKTYKDGDTLKVSVTVTDIWGFTSTAATTVTYSVDVVDTIYFESPKTGDAITSPWMFNGYANSEYVSLRNAINGLKFCTIKTENDLWGCELSLAPGRYRFVAYGITEQGGETGKSDVVFFTVREAPVNEPVLELTAPKDGEVVSTLPTFTGTIANSVKDGSVVVINVSEGKPVCSATVSMKDESWSCTADKALEPGKTYEINVTSDTFDALYTTQNIHISVDEDIIEKPELLLTDPADSELISLRPTFSGVITGAQENGQIDVWMTLNDSVVKVCTADFVLDEEGPAIWRCTVGYDLTPDTQFVAYARYEAADVTSNAITLFTQPEDVASIKITSPANGAILKDTYPIIFAGTATPGAIIDVYIESDGMQPNSLCSASTNEDGIWTCVGEPRLTAGEYIAYADDASDDVLIFSPGVSFTVWHEYNEWPEDEYSHGARGGSCSIAPASTSSTAPWMLLIAGAVGLGLMRRRREHD